MTTVYFDDIRVGDQSQYVRTVTQSDIDAFARVSGDNNPVHLSENFAKATAFGGIIAHGMLTASYISTVLGTQYPGQGTIFIGLDALSFRGPVRPGDTITTTLTVAEKHATKPVVTFDCQCVNQNGDTVLTARAIVRAPQSPSARANPTPPRR